MIKMSNDDNNLKLKEQTINKNRVPDNFYHALEVFLNKDEFDIFKTRSKRKLNRVIKKSNDRIQKLLILKEKSGVAIKRLSKKKKQLKLQNLKLKESIIEALELEVV